MRKKKVFEDQYFTILVDSSGEVFIRNKRSGLSCLEVRVVTRVESNRFIVTTPGCFMSSTSSHGLPALEVRPERSPVIR